MADSLKKEISPLCLLIGGSRRKIAQTYFQTQATYPRTGALYLEISLLYFSKNGIFPRKKCQKFTCAIIVFSQKTNPFFCKPLLPLENELVVKFKKKAVFPELFSGKFSVCDFSE